MRKIVNIIHRANICAFNDYLLLYYISCFFLIIFCLIFNKNNLCHKYNDCKVCHIFNWTTIKIKIDYIFNHIKHCFEHIIAYFSYFNVYLKKTSVINIRPNSDYRHKYIKCNWCQKFRIITKYIPKKQLASNCNLFW